MKIILTILLSMFATREINVTQARNLFIRSYKSETAARDLNAMLKDGLDNDLLAQGYKGVSEIMLCNYVGNPFLKLAHFNRGRKILESAIKNAPSNAELRYLRFTIQTNIPSLLNYNSKIDADKHSLLTYLMQEHQTDQQLTNMITDYLLGSPKVTKEEKDKIRSLKND